METRPSWQGKLRAILDVGGLRSWKERREIAASGLFDRTWYLANTPGVAGSGLDPLEHYVRKGWREGFSPGPEFDSAWYRLRYNDVAAAGIDPLLHFIRAGKSEGRLPRASTPDLLDEFQSLGADCEFGFVQRHFNCRILSLFGFATTSPSSMLNLLESEDATFADKPECLDLSIGENGEYMITVEPHGFLFHTNLSSTKWDADQVRSHELKRLQFLWRKLREDLEEGGRIFVVKAQPSRLPLQHAARLASALRRQAVNHLLWVVPVPGRTLPGSVNVTDLGNGLMRADIDRFDNNRMLCSVDLWHEACRRAHELRSRERAASLIAGSARRSRRDRAR